jgi:hypothetical protein
MESMLNSTPPLALLSLSLWFLVLVPLVLHQFVIYSPLLIPNYANTTQSSLPPLLDPSARSQFRAICYRQISARMLAVALQLPRPLLCAS